MDHDLKVLVARLHLRYDDILDTETRMDYKSFTPDIFEGGRVWISTDAKARAAFMQLCAQEGIRI